MNVRAITLVLLTTALFFSTGLPAVAGGQQEAEEEPTEIDIPSQPRQYISPENDDGVDDVLTLPFDVIPAPDAVIVEYNLAIFDNSGNVVFSQSQAEPRRRNFFERILNQPKPEVELPDSLTWDGTYLNSDQGSDGEPVPDGEYSYQLRIRDDLGNIAQTPPFNLTVDNTAPQVRSLQQPEFSIFSPNRDGIRESITIRQETTREVSWTGTIRNEEGDAVWQQTWENPNPSNPADDVTPPAAFEWDGTYQLPDDERNGEVAPEGSYTYELTSTDRAGNSTERTANYSVTLSLTAGDIQLSVEGDGYFSPNDDGTKDRVTFTTTVTEPEGLTAWEINVAPVDDPDDSSRTIEGAAPVPSSVTFNGRDGRGRRLPDGEYQVAAMVTYENGTQVRSDPASIVIDTQAPQASISASTQPEATRPDAPLVFGGENKEAVQFNVRLTEGEPWTATVETPEDSMSGNLSDLGFRGPSFEFTWEGNGPEGEEMADGIYTVSLQATDRAGNTGTSNAVRVRKFTQDTPIDVSVSSDMLTPNDDDENETVTIRPEFEVSELIDQFLLEIKNSDGFVVRSLYRTAPFDSFEWNGTNNAGGPVQEGDYYVDFQIVYFNGDRPRVEGVGPVNLDRGPDERPATPPNVQLSAQPLPFSPDGDGYRDTVQLRLRAASVDPVREWELEIRDPAGNLFRTFTGEEEPPRFIDWNGRAEDGELVQAASDYEAELTVTDVNGETGTAETTLPVDVLVFRDDQGRVLINVPSINFAGFSADLFDVERDLLDTNLQTLRRVAEILKRYPDYEITVEGHAAHVFYRNEERMEREQEQVLLPLSRNRAREVYEALVILGLDRDRMTTTGVGGNNPVVPHSNREEIWKNRRVLFILERERSSGGS
jgi:outer membrane protein OmpA-like peptidoglycan-associated protein